MPQDRYKKLAEKLTKKNMKKGMVESKTKKVVGKMVEMKKKSEMPMMSEIKPSKVKTGKPPGKRDSLSGGRKLRRGMS